MVKRIYEEPKAEVMEFENTGNIVTWSIEVDPDNLGQTSWDDPRW